MSYSKTSLLFIPFAALLVLGSGEAHAQRRQARVSVFNMGTANDSDRENAKAQARDNAENGLVCIGQLDNVRTTVSCMKLGEGESEQWLCTANATGMCTMGG